MTTFAIFPNIRDQSAHFKKIRHILADVDAVLFVGNLTNGAMDHLHRLLNTVEPYNEHILAICGNTDTIQMNMMLARDDISVHRRHERLDGLAIIGVGAANPYGGGCYVYDEATIAAHLDDTMQGVPVGAPVILMSYYPPRDTALDTVDGEATGSTAVRAFIERVQPIVCFCGHLDHAAQDRIGNTRIFNAGAIADGTYGYLDIEDGEILTLETRTVEVLKI